MMDDGQKEEDKREGKKNEGWNKFISVKRENIWRGKVYELFSC